MMYSEDEYLMLSGVQHFAFCRRQWALIHIEQQWEENSRTVDGNIMHERVHDADFHEKRGELVITRAMAVSSARNRELVCDGYYQLVSGHYKLYYGEIRRRVKVVFDAELRKRTEDIINEMHDLYKKQYTPKVKRRKCCNACSLKNICLPIICGNKKASDYVEKMLDTEGDQ